MNGCNYRCVGAVLATVFSAMGGFYLLIGFGDWQSQWKYAIAAIFLGGGVVLLSCLCRAAPESANAGTAGAANTPAAMGAWPCGKIIAIIWFVSASIFLAKMLFDRLSVAEPRGMASTSWRPHSKIQLLPGPPQFYFDDETEGAELKYDGVLTAEVRKELIELFPPFEAPEAAKDTAAYQHAINRLARESQSKDDSQVRWQPSSDRIYLKPGPASFLYDQERNELQFKGKIDDETKAKLLELFSYDASDALREHQQDAHSYRLAINRLMRRSMEQLDTQIAALLVLGGLGGALGSMIRVIATFVGHACYTKKLDQETWWPTYILNPLIGFLMGGMVVILVRTGWMTVESTPTSGSMWWLGLAALAGFGISDVSERLRLITKAAFGVQEKKDPKVVQPVSTAPPAGRDGADGAPTAHGTVAPPPPATEGGGAE